MPIAAIVVTGAGLDFEPVLNQQRRVPDSDAFLAADEINDAAAGVTVPEANPTVLGQADSELHWVVTGVNGAGSAETVPAPMQPVQQSVTVQNLGHGNRLLERIEADEFNCGFHKTPL